MSVYKVVEIIGTSPNSWRDAAKEAIATAQGSLRGLRVAEVVKTDIDLAGDEPLFRVKLSVSFKYEGNEGNE